MKNLKFKQIIYLIFSTALITVAVQVYTNVQNYKVNKQRFERDIQQALDIAVEAYYAQRAKNQIILYEVQSDILDSGLIQKRISTASNISIDSMNRFISSAQNKGSLKAKKYFRDSILSSYTSVSIDSSRRSNLSSLYLDSLKVDSISNLTVQIVLDEDSLGFQSMAKKLLASFKDASIDFERLVELTNKELARKNLVIDFQLVYTTPQNVYYSSEENPAYELSSFSKSTYLRNNQSIEIRYGNTSLAILKRGAFQFFLSLLIILAVMGSLIYLYQVINQQKQLAEIKNDLISNITHEFKTPIATISTAIEGITLFNTENDLDKTKKYLGISSDQLKKLNLMVEKLLETASLDSDQIQLNQEPVDLVQLTRQVIDQYGLTSGTKSIHYEYPFNELICSVDRFHIENVLGNLIDNAIKYGGDRIDVSLNKNGDQVLWEITDNGGQISKSEQSHIFEKFYRIPTGNLHDVKGFGIGLYYAKTMVEKHGGNISLEVSKGQTKFTITI